MEDAADREAVRSFSRLSISHEAHFDIEDSDRGTVRCSVYYVTFEGEDEEEETFFFAGEKAVSRPLDCVVAFWEQVRDVGRDADFALLRLRREIPSCRKALTCRRSKGRTRRQNRRLSCLLRRPSWPPPFFFAHWVDNVCIFPRHT